MKIDWKEKATEFLTLAIVGVFVIFLAVKVAPYVVDGADDYLQARAELREGRERRAQQKLGWARSDCQRGDQAACIEYAELLRKSN